MSKIKLLMARVADATLFSGAALRLQRMAFRPHIRAVNYHDLLPEEAGQFEEQVRIFAEHFSPVGYDDLLGLVAGRWDRPKPGLIISFDDGLRSHGEVAAPILERHGFVGWFFVPAGFVDCPPEGQREFARAHDIKPRGPADVPDGGRLALTWDEVAELARKHVVGCHTLTHRRFRAEVPEADLVEETAGAKRRMEEKLGREVPTFAWVGGEEWAYSAAAARAIARAGFKAGFMTNNALIRPGDNPLQLQRTNLESHFPHALTRFQLSGFLDLLYRPKRARVNRVTAVDGTS